MNSRELYTFLLLLTLSGISNAMANPAAELDSPDLKILDVPKELLQGKKPASQSVHKIYQFPKLAAFIMPSNKPVNEVPKVDASEVEAKEFIDQLMIDSTEITSTPVKLPEQTVAAPVSKPAESSITESAMEKMDSMPEAHPVALPMEASQAMPVVEPAAIEQPVAANSSFVQTKPTKKSKKAIRKQKSQKKQKLARDEKDRQLGSMLRQFFHMLGFVPEDGTFFGSSRNKSNIRPGWYIGGLVGATINQSRLMIWDQYTDPLGRGTYPPFQFKKRFENTLPAFGIQLGKQFVYGKLLTDISAFFMGSFTSNKVKIIEEDSYLGVTTVYENNLKEKYRAGINMAVGTPITDNVSVFGKLGITYSNFSFQYREPTSNGNAGKGMVGIAPGVLFKYHPNPKFALSLDISYAQALGVMKTGNISSDPYFKYYANIRPRGVTVLLGFNRTF